MKLKAYKFKVIAPEGESAEKADRVFRDAHQLLCDLIDVENDYREARQQVLEADARYAKAKLNAKAAEAKWCELNDQAKQHKAAKHLKSESVGLPAELPEKIAAAKAHMQKCNSTVSRLSIQVFDEMVPQRNTAIQRLLSRCCAGQPQDVTEDGDDKKETRSSFFRVVDSDLDRRQAGLLIRLFEARKKRRDGWGPWRMSVKLCNADGTERSPRSIESMRLKELLLHECAAIEPGRIEYERAKKQAAARYKDKISTGIEEHVRRRVEASVKTTPFWKRIRWPSMDVSTVFVAQKMPLDSVINSKANSFVRITEPKEYGRTVYSKLKDWWRPNIGSMWIRLKQGRKDPEGLQVKVIFHRAMPEGSVVRGVRLMRKRRESRGYDWSVVITCEDVRGVNAQKPRLRRPVVYLHQGYSQINGVGLRVLQWTDGTGGEPVVYQVPPKRDGVIPQAQQNWRALESGGAIAGTGVLVFPQHMIDRCSRSEELVSKADLWRDKMLPQIRSEVKQLNVPESMERWAAQVMRKKGRQQLAKLYQVLEANRFAGDEVLLKVFRLWFTRNDSLVEHFVALRDSFRNARTNAYRLLARRFEQSFELVRLPKLELAKMKKRPDVEEAWKQSPQSRWNADKAALGEFKLFLSQALGDRLVYQGAEYITMLCPYCATREGVDRATQLVQLGVHKGRKPKAGHMHVCVECGAVSDRDAAALVIQALRATSD